MSGLTDITTTDRELLRQFRDERNEAAFAELVRRHVNLVYGAALRVIKDDGLAQEVSQNVFAALARKSAWLAAEETLAGWLYRCAVLEARQALRSELRRQRRDSIAVELGSTMKDEESVLRSLSGALDDVLLDLSDADRKALLLRYFEDLSHKEIGQRFGAGEDAGRKRVQKALDQLTAKLRKRGYALAGATTVSAALKSAAAITAPTALGSACVSAAVSAAGSAAAFGTISIAVAKIMSLTKTQTAAVCLIVAALPIGVQWQRAEAARVEYITLQQQWSVAQARVTALASTNAAISDRLRQDQGSLGRLQREGKRLREFAANARTNLYAWPPSGDYIRIPKSLAAKIEMTSTRRMPRQGGGVSEDREPALSDRGEPSKIMQEALGITDVENARLMDLYQQAKAEFDQAAQKSQYVTNGFPSRSYSAGLPHARSLVTDPFPEDGATIKTRLLAGVDDALGPERSSILNFQESEALKTRFNNFGENRRYETLFWGDDGRIAVGQGQFAEPWTSSYNASVSSGPVSSLPPYLKDLLPPEVIQRAIALELNQPPPQP